MKSAFAPRLINGPFGDPGLYVYLRWLGRGLLFDLGNLERLPGPAIARLTHVFVSHTHLDHFVGFDRVLRVFLARDVELALYGPAGFAENVAGKLRGYTWNLVENYPFSLLVHEVLPEKVLVYRFRAQTGFAAEEVGERPFAGILHREPSLWVEAAILDHRIPCLAFALCEPVRLNIRTDALQRLGIPPGRWLNELKERIRNAEPDSTPITIQWTEQGQLHTKQFQLGDLRRELVLETAGTKICYVVDTLFHRANVERIVNLIQKADILYCESLFLDEDRDEASKRYHLTARQAGTLARLAGVRELRTFHFSPRYSGQAQRLIAEAQATFRGELPPDEP
ncbi:MAG: ribonuclease Z [Candidatus Binatia bacterium]|nr:ribonuclease Z [Candidatus Binatia bacterium]